MKTEHIVVAVLAIGIMGVVIYFMNKQKFVPTNTSWSGNSLAFTL